MRKLKRGRANAQRFAPCLLVLWAMLSGPVGCRTLPLQKTTPPAAAVEHWKRTELFFGLSKPGGTVVSESEWKRFLTEEIVPAFPDGLTVLAADGCWKDASGNLKQEPSRLILVLYPRANFPVVDSKMRLLTKRYIERFHQESVLRSDSDSDVLFYSGPLAQVVPLQTDRNTVKPSK